MRQIVNINKKWAFSKRFDIVPTELTRDWYWVNLPHTWNAIDGQDGGNDYYRGNCCYVKRIEKVDLPEADRYYLEINGANSVAEVFIGGKKFAHHEGGYSAWRVDITSAVTDSMVLAITVDNSDNKTVYPQAADFTLYGGLYRDVNIIAVSEAHFDLEHYGGSGITVTPRIEIKRESGSGALKGIKKMFKSKTADVEITTSAVNADGLTVRYIIKAADGTISAETTSDAGTVTLRLKNPRLWNGTDDPYLYTAEAYLLRDGKAIDKVSARFGIRVFDIDPSEGFFLNGRPYPLRGVSRHQDRWEVGSALLPEHHREDIDLICELGANSVRLVCCQQDRYFCDLCDERGIVVWAEIPYMTGHVPQAKENTASQLRELIIQNYNHPSIAVWGLSSEITQNGSDPDMVQNHVILNTLAHKLDPTRKTVVAAASDCDIHEPYLQIPDAAAYNRCGDADACGQWFDDFRGEYPDRAIAVSGYGCEVCDDGDEEYQAGFHEEMIKQLFSRKYIWATYVSNMFDYGADGSRSGREHSGLVTFDRKYKKDAFYAYKARLSREPFVHICGKRFMNRSENSVTVTVYSNQPEVELFLNGKSFCKEKDPDHFFKFTVLNEGEEETRLKVTAGKFSDESVIIWGSTPLQPETLLEVRDQK